MIIRGDYSGVMNTRQRQLVETFEAAVEGRNVDGGDPFVAELADGMRSYFDTSAPVATGPLQVLLTQGLPADVLAASSTLDVDVPAPAPAPELSGRLPVISVAVAKIAGLTLVAKVALASVALAAGTAGVGAAGALPAPAQAAFDRVASIVSNVDNRAEQADRTDNRTDVRPHGDDGGPPSPGVDPGRRDGGVRDLIDRREPEDRDRQFGRDIAEETSRNRPGDVAPGQSQRPDVENHTRPSSEYGMQFDDREEDEISGDITDRSVRPRQWRH